MISAAVVPPCPSAPFAADATVPATPSLWPLDRDAAWWAVESARAESDWPSICAAALEMMVIGGILEPQPDTTSSGTLSSWNAPSWREAAIAYHKDRRGHRLVIEIDPKRLARLRRLMANEISLERALHELRSNFQKG
jgi:hypothetical protein